MEIGELTVAPPSDPVRSVMPRCQPDGTRRDRELADALRVRDESALGRIQAELGPLLLGYLTAMLGDRAAAEDVLQVTLLEVWDRGASFDPARASLVTWVMMIARSRAIDQLRRRVPEPRDPASTGTQLDRAAVTAEDPSEALLEQWRVAELLTRLPAEEAAMLRLRFYDGLPQREIAERMAVPLGTVKMRMVHALERLHRMLDEPGSIA
jgi:RNA polymerase sigma-70 factor (ECF subfamily)